jgi:hypothetical protein
MGKISLEDLRPGMILAGEVKERSGRVLLCAGVEITEKHLDIFKKWGISGADIQGVTQEDMTPQLDPAVLQQAEMEAQELFRHTDRQHLAVIELLRLTTLRLAQYESGGQGS